MKYQELLQVLQKHPDAPRAAPAKALGTSLSDGIRIFTNLQIREFRSNTSIRATKVPAPYLYGIRICEFVKIRIPSGNS